MKRTAAVTNIQRFSIDDGPGIRTTVFFKGCPLNCLWCHNPECISAKPQLQYFDNLCCKCGNCVNHCAQGVHTMKDSKHIIDFKRCSACRDCISSCPGGALRVIPYYLTAEQLEREILKDLDFFTCSGGGITFSGGEPTLQATFLSELMANLKKKNIHLAVDTCGYADSSQFQQIFPYTDLFLYDIKALDPVLHHRLTGLDNGIILDNLSLINSRNIPVWIRIPLIKGLNDDLDLLSNTAKFLAQFEVVKKVELLKYHSMGVAKYSSIGISPQKHSFLPPEDNSILKILGFFEKAQIPVAYR